MRDRFELIFLVLAIPLIVACSEKDSSRGADVAAMGNPELQCAGCHPRHVAEWKMSSHAYAMHDPVFTAMVKVGQRDTAGKLADFCVKCHSPIGNARNETDVVQDPATLEFMQPTSGLSQAAMDGVSCYVCHSITGVNGTANAEFVMTLDGTRHGPIYDPAKDAPHRSEFSDLFEHPKICGTCHMVVNPKNVPLEETHIEWVQSVFNGQKSCQDCHMPSYTGPAATGHVSRTVHEHTFVGVDVPLLPPDEFPGYDDMRQRADQLLKTSVQFSMEQGATARTLNVVIRNLAGHALPSGATTDREMWVELHVRDLAGASAFESGTVDGNGDLRVPYPERTTQPGTDPQLVLYNQDMLLDPSIDDPTSTEPARLVDFLWEPNAASSHLIHVSTSDRRSYDLSALQPGGYKATARLLFRSFPPHLLRKLEQIGDLDPNVKNRVPTVEMAKASLDLNLP